ncbi:MAG: chemotaxis response regulator protein-glutamate methylesterase [Rhodocyclaceae bacterium]|nr:chemotaxis response regulator protein-glutamate methylesterase [Rhodocyclaceae bacterium]MBK6909211.1 chemotaxis response regulator protein-glutamate methylesterase [Rhodocyclaceae bacterium]
MTIRVLVVDDSALMRALLTQIINDAPDIEVVGSAPDPIAAREMIKVLNPDVLTLDVEMPKMDGLEFLDRIMRLRPMPVIMISAMTERGSEVTLKALELGAVDFVAKPRAESISLMHSYAEEICDKIRAAKGARLKGTPARTLAAAVAAPAHKAGTSAGFSQRLLNDTIIAIGASTGGTEAIKDVLVALPADMPPIVMTQHMPETFTPSFAKRLDTLSALTVIEAQGGERLQPGHAYLAPGHSHMVIRRTAGGYVTELNQNEPVNRHRPSVDVLFWSVAEQAKGPVIGVILTGMGKDGAQGLLSLRNGGAHTIGQDQASCVVYGMPREAALVGAVAEVASLDGVSNAILNQLRRLDRG